jgi:hypothetical protein
VRKTGLTTPLKELVGPSVKLQNIAIHESNHSLKIGVISISLTEAVKARKMLCNLAVGRDELFKGIVIVSR